MRFFVGVFLACLVHVFADYRAAVVEFAPQLAKDGATEEEIQFLKLQNLQRLEGFARLAKMNGTQIIVFPEYGITGDGFVEQDFTSRGLVQPFLEEVPENIQNPCQQANELPRSPSVVRASCLASELQMVMVINLLTRSACNMSQRVPCPADGQLIHNTAVAFAETGAILKVYHKQHPYELEHNFLDVPPPDQAQARFKASFGVEFGMFICFDIFWEAGPGIGDVDDFVFTTDWVNKPQWWSPSARATQLAWSLWHQKNFLASNYGGFGRNSSGSGIYHRGHILATFFNPSTEPESRLLIADVPKSRSEKPQLTVVV
mmetsp:Transcript_54519/g.100884  ORF Transcript_54519/g.100884 Transcript_54519/m.100884 type:complete len:317 (+) Transcript_54519:82-1032(+)